MNPEVSVIIPAYNTEAFIGKAISSALAQTRKDIEIIVVDDASTDETAQVAKNSADKRVKVLINPQNRGAAFSRNRAIEEARGTWIAVLDSDDWYAPERLEKLLDLAYANNADMIADDLFFIRDGEQSPWSTLIRESGELIETIKPIDSVYFVETDRAGQQGLHLGFSKPLIKRAFLAEHNIQYDNNLRMSQDFWLYLKCLVNNARFFLVPQAYYFYRSRHGSLVTQSQIKRIDMSCQAILDFIEQDVVKNPLLERALRKNLSEFKKIRSYCSVVEPLKKGEFQTAVIEMSRNPYFFLRLTTEILKILERRRQYYFLDNKFVYETMYQNGRKRQPMLYVSSIQSRNNIYSDD